MHRPLDTLYYQWATDEDQKTLPGIFEEVSGLDDSEKIDGLLRSFSHMVVDVMEAAAAHDALVEHYIERASTDTDLLKEAGAEEIAKAIEQFPDIVESQTEVDKVAARLDTFQAQLTRALTADSEI